MVINEDAVKPSIVQSDLEKYSTALSNGKNVIIRLYSVKHVKRGIIEFKPARMVEIVNGKGDLIYKDMRKEK